MFWVDEIIGDIVNKVKKNEILITDWKTPSGHIHIGALRGVAIHDLVRQGLSQRKYQATFQYGFDDFDPMDSLPVYIDESFNDQMGKPLCHIPAPDGKSKNYAIEFSNEFQQVFKRLGFKPTIVYNSQFYKEGKYDQAIRIVLDNAQEIRKIYQEVSGSTKGDDWFPFQVICPKCGKIGTTKVTAWNGKEVKFICQENLVTWAKGCGYKGSTSPFGGRGKIPWKVEWAAKWTITKTDIEGEGKDHFAAGGSRDVADAICRQVFKKEPPYDIRYEHFLVEGAKMSSSKGLGVTAKDMADFLPANILRFLFIRTRYKRAINFQPEAEAIPLLYDEYDRIAKTYHKHHQNELARAYYYSEAEPRKAPKYFLRFSKIAYMLQMPRVDIFDYAEKEKGEKLTAIEKAEIEDRIKIAKKWLKKFAPESYKFTIAKKLPAAAKKLTLEQKKFLGKILQVYQAKDSWSGEDLHPKIHQIRKEMGIDPRIAFSSIYLIFIGKDSGPQAGWLLASLDRDFVIERLKEIVNEIV